MGWLGKLLGGGDGSKSGPPSGAGLSMQRAGEGTDTTGAPAVDGPAAGAEPDGKSARPASALEIDLAWYRLLATSGTHPAPPEVAARVLEDLARLAAAPAAGAAMVPRVPEIIPQLLRLLLEEDMNVTALARALGRDPVLVAELYREANRPLYRPRYHAGPPVSSIDGAIMLLGQSGMRMLLMRIALRPILSMQNGRMARRTAPAIWRQSEKCATAASSLAPGLQANAFEAYLAGLMHNVGLIVAFRLIDELDLEDALPQDEDFVAALFAHARALSARIASLWEFPDAVAAAIAQTDAEDPVTRALALGDRLAKLRMLVDAGRFQNDDPFVTSGLDGAALDSLERIRDEDDEQG